MRNLVLLLSSGHTVRIALRDDAIAPTHAGVLDFLEALPAMNNFASNEIVFGYTTDNTAAIDDAGNDFNRITVLSPGSSRG